MKFKVDFRIPACTVQPLFVFGVITVTLISVNAALLVADLDLCTFWPSVTSCGAAVWFGWRLLLPCEIELLRLFGVPLFAFAFLVFVCL